MSAVSRAAKLLNTVLGRQRPPVDDDPSRDYAVRTDWTQSAGRLNYSSFVFFDVDRDGVYSWGDRPMGGIMVRLSQDNRQLAAARTNTNGFANFTTAADKKKTDISAPGLYQFAVSVPDGWRATGDNAVQSKEFRLIPGSSSGIGADEMVKPVGLAPERIVRGRLEGTPGSLKELSQDAVVSETEMTAAEEFGHHVSDEADAVVLSTAGAEWRVPVSAYPVNVGVLDPTKGLLGPRKQIENIDFDDVNPRGLRKIPCGYRGLNWFNLNAFVRDFSGGHQGYVNANTSGDHIAYTSSGHPAELWSDKPFDFVGVHLAAAWLGSEGETGVVESWRGDELVAKDSLSLSALTPVYYSPMLPDITRIRFSTEHYWQMVLDDLVIAR